MRQAPEGALSHILAAIQNEPRIDSQHFPLQIAMQDGNIVLEGKVQNITAKKLIHYIAQDLGDGHPILNRLRVTAAKLSLNGSNQDGALRDEVIKNLLQESVFSEHSLKYRRNGESIVVREMGKAATGELEIEVNEAVVSLRGHVGSLTHRRLAEVLAWWTSRCEIVENQLRVVPPEKENDDELIDALRIVLEKDPLVHASQLSIQAKGGKVTLEGYVSSKEEKKLAVLDVWYVPGVHDVVDHIATPRH